VRLRAEEKAYRGGLDRHPRVALMKIELSSEELAEELQKHLEEKRFAGASYDKARRTIEFPDMSPAQWASLRGTVEKWARGRKLEIEESLKIQSPPEAPQAKTRSKEQEAELRKRLEAMTLEEAEARYNYLQGKPFSELTDEEYEERLALADTLSKKSKGK
jgi:fructose-bisphosphate aldolase class 1